MNMLKQLSRDNLEEVTVAVLRDAQNARPAVRLVKADGVTAVVKDFAASSNVFKRLLGAYLISREYAAYRHLEGVSGVPACYGCLDAYALVLQHVSARSAVLHLSKESAPDFFAQLRHLVDEIHSRGVVHGDLRNLGNILIDDEGRPVLVDFAASFVTGSSPLAVLVFPALVDDDLRGVLKLKQKVTPELMTPDEAEFLHYRPPAELFFRSWREYVRRAVKRWAAVAEPG